MVALFIISQACDSDLHSEADEDVKGTGGSDILPFLSKIREKYEGESFEVVKLEEIKILFWHLWLLDRGVKNL